MRRRRNPLPPATPKQVATGRPAGWHNRKSPLYVGRVRCCGQLHAIAITRRGAVAVLGHECLDSELMLQALAADSDKALRCVQVLEAIRKPDTLNREFSGELDTAMRLIHKKHSDRHIHKPRVALDPFCADSRPAVARYGIEVPAVPRPPVTLSRSALLQTRVRALALKHPIMRRVRDYVVNLGFRMTVATSWSPQYRSHTSSIGEDLSKRRPSNFRTGCNLEVSTDIHNKKLKFIFRVDPGEWLLNAAEEGLACRHRGLYAMDDNIMIWHVEELWKTADGDVDSAIISYLTYEDIVEKLGTVEKWKTEHWAVAIDPEVGGARRTQPDRWEFIPLRTLTQKHSF